MERWASPPADGRDAGPSITSLSILRIPATLASRYISSQEAFRRARTVPDDAQAIPRPKVAPWGF
jgi:hypothetical protein